MTIQELIDIDYNTEDRVSRRKTKEVNSQEFFTPYQCVRKMCEMIPEEDWENPDKIFLEPCFGNGNFVLYIIYKRLMCGIPYYKVLLTLYGTELMKDNVYETKARVIKLFDMLGIDYDEDLALNIMDRNLVQADFFKWDYENWKPIKED